MALAPERSRTVARGRFPAGPGARSHPESTSTKTSAQARAEEGRATGAGEGGGGASAEEGHRRRRHDNAAVRGEGRRSTRIGVDAVTTEATNKIGEDLAEEEEGDGLYRQSLWYRVKTSPGANGCLRHRFLYHPVPL